MSNQATQANNQHRHTGYPATTLPWDRVREPGAYVCNWSGHLVRVPEDSMTTRRTPAVDIIGEQPLFVTKICDDPYIPLTKARLLTSGFDINVNF